MEERYESISVTEDGWRAGGERLCTGEGFSVIQGGAEAAQAREDPYKQSVLPVESRYEVIDGVVYMMASPKFWHQKVFSKMYSQLEWQLAPHGCEVMQAPFDVYLFWEKGDQHNFVEPDLFIVCDQEQLKRLNASEQDYYHGAPMFVVEVLSPSNGEHDLVRKAELYYRAGVAEYWVVDPITGDNLAESTCQVSEYTPVGMTHYHPT